MKPGSILRYRQASCLHFWARCLLQEGLVAQPCALPAAAARLPPSLHAGATWCGLGESAATFCPPLCELQRGEITPCGLGATRPKAGLMPAFISLGRAARR